MAKLSARGATVLVKLTREQTTISDIADLKRTSVAFTSDGRRLAKLQVHMKATAYVKAYWHDYGWKVMERQVSPERREFLVTSLKASGYLEDK